MIRRPPRSTLTDTLFPDTTLFQTIICDKRRAFLRQRLLHDGMAPTFYGKALRFFEMLAAPATFCRTLRQRGADIKAGKRVGSAGALAFSRQHRLNQFLQMRLIGSHGIRTSRHEEPTP